MLLQNASQSFSDCQKQGSHYRKHNQLKPTVIFLLFGRLHVMLQHTFAFYCRNVVALDVYTLQI